jgi:predicted ATPase
VPRLVAVTAQVRATLGLPAGAPNPLDQLAAHLSGLHTLLVLDNFEQLVGQPGDDPVSALLQRAPGLHLLVTSRPPGATRAWPCSWTARRRCGRISMSIRTTCPA